jgi:hypothetical protein
MTADPGTFIAGLCSLVRNHIEHARKHLGEIERNLEVIQNGVGIDVRSRAVGEALQHCDVVASDMRIAKRCLNI